MRLELAPAESARFGLRVFRGSCEAIDAENLAAQLVAEAVDVAILRLPSSAVGQLWRLRDRGLEPFVADTLMSYETHLGGYRPRELRDPRLQFRLSGPEVAPLLAEMVGTIFDGYVSHFHGNPLFDPAAIVRGYEEWAVGHLQSGSGRTTWIVYDDQRPLGFSCCRLDPDGDAHGVLNGILPAARGQGRYRDLLRFMLVHFSNVSASRFRISTQSHNLAVQRVWASEGLLPYRSEATVHINCSRTPGRQKT